MSGKLESHKIRLTEINSDFLSSLLENEVKGHNLANVKILVGSGVNVKNTLRLVDYAAETNQVDMVQFLLAAGARFTGYENFQNHLKEDAFFHACLKGHTQIVKLLLQTGVNPNKLVRYSNDCKTILSVAIDLGNFKIVKLLLDAGADVGACEIQSLYSAFKDDHPEIIETLLLKIINSNMASSLNSHRHNTTLLHISTEAGYEDLAKAVINISTYDNIKNMKDHALLECAIRNKQIAIVKILLEAGVAIIDGLRSDNDEINDLLAIAKIAEKISNNIDCFGDNDLTIEEKALIETFSTSEEIMANFSARSGKLIAQKRMEYLSDLEECYEALDYVAERCESFMKEQNQVLAVLRGNSTSSYEYRGNSRTNHSLFEVPINFSKYSSLPNIEEIKYNFYCHITKIIVSNMMDQKPLFPSMKEVINEINTKKEYAKIKDIFIKELSAQVKEKYFKAGSKSEHICEKYSSILSSDEIEITIKAIEEAKDIIRTNVLDIIAAMLGIDPIPPLLSMLEKDSTFLSVLIDWKDLNISANPTKVESIEKLFNIAKAHIETPRELLFALFESNGDITSIIGTNIKDFLSVKSNDGYNSAQNIVYEAIKSLEKLNLLSKSDYWNLIVENAGFSYQFKHAIPSLNIEFFPDLAEGEFLVKTEDETEQFGLIKMADGTIVLRLVDGIDWLSYPYSIDDTLLVTNTHSHDLVTSELASSGTHEPVEKLESEDNYSASGLAILGTGLALLAFGAPS